MQSDMLRTRRLGQWWAIAITDALVSFSQPARLTTWSLAPARAITCARASSVILYVPPSRMACKLPHLHVAHDTTATSHAAAAAATSHASGVSRQQTPQSREENKTTTSLSLSTYIYINIYKWGRVWAAPLGEGEDGLVADGLALVEAEGLQGRASLGHLHHRRVAHILPRRGHAQGTTIHGRRAGRVSDDHPPPPTTTTATTSVVQLEAKSSGGHRRGGVRCGVVPCTARGRGGRARGSAWPGWRRPRR